MAVYSQAAGDREVAEYLYELNENLTYMFSHLTPEDNYSEEARLVYVQRGQRISTLEVRADAIELRVADDERNYNTSMQLFADLLKLTATTPTGSSTIAMTGEKITLKTGKFIVDSTNLQLDAQGNAEFSGTVRAAQIISSNMTSSTISATTISASTINGSTINGGDSIRFKARAGYLQFGDFIVDDSYGRHTLMSYDECTGMSTGDVSANQLLLWAGYDGDDYAFAVNGNGGVHVDGNFYYKGTELQTLIVGLINEYGGGDEEEEEP